MDPDLKPMYVYPYCTSRLVPLGRIAHDEAAECADIENMYVFTTLNTFALKRLFQCSGYRIRTVLQKARDGDGPTALMMRRTCHFKKTRYTTLKVVTMLENRWSVGHISNMLGIYPLLIENIKAEFIDTKQCIPDNNKGDDADEPVRAQSKSPVGENEAEAVFAWEDFLV